MQSIPGKLVAQTTPIQLTNVFSTKLYAAQFPMPVDNTPFSRQPVLQLSTTVTSGGNALFQVEVGGEISFMEDPHPFEIEARIAGVFQSQDETLTPDEIVQWLEQSALHVLFPFLREAILDLSIRLRITPVLLPLIDAQSAQLVRTSEESPAEAPPSKGPIRPQRSPENR